MDRDKRRREILNAVLALLREGGIDAVSTARIAARAQCSKETLYAWFGDRAGIFRALVAEQTAALNAMLAREAAGDAPPRETLERAGAALLDLLTGEASLAINRAAMADGSGDMARDLREEGRGRFVPLFVALIERLQGEGVLTAGDARDQFVTFYGLLIGDRQIRALLGDEAARPATGAFEEIARQAMDGLIVIHGPVSGKT